MVAPASSSCASACCRPPDRQPARKLRENLRSAGDQRGHEVVVPGGGCALALEAGLQGGVGAREVERDLAEQGLPPVGWTRVTAYAAAASSSLQTGVT